MSNSIAVCTDNKKLQKKVFSKKISKNIINIHPKEKPSVKM